MITSIRMRNFRAHRDLAVDFGQVTTLVGPTDAGKSTILHFLRWVLTNESYGDIVAWGESHVAGTVSVDGHEVSRRKGRENYYSLDGGTPHDAVGRSVPPEIAGLFNVADVNFQGQLDPHFWLSETPGEISKQLNRVADLASLDEAAAAIASEVTREGAAVASLTDTLDEAKKKRADLAWVVGADAELADVEALELAASEKLNRIDYTARALGLVRNARAAANTAVMHESGAADRLRAAASWVDMASRAASVEAGVRKLADALASVRQWDAKVRVLQRASEQAVEQLSLADDWMRAEARYAKLHGMRASLESDLERLRKIRESAESLRRRAGYMEADLTAQAGGVCPACNRPLEGDTCLTT